MRTRVIDQNNALRWVGDIEHPVPACHFILPCPGELLAPKGKNASGITRHGLRQKVLETSASIFGGPGDQIPPVFTHPRA